MKDSVTITLGVQIAAGLYALHKNDTFGSLLAFAGAATVYFANIETDQERANRLAMEHATALQSETDAAINALAAKLGM